MIELPDGTSLRDGRAALLTMCTPSTISTWRAMAREACSPAEWERAERFRFEWLTRRFLCGRVMLRDVIAAVTGRDPATLRIEKAESGRLVLPDVDLAPSVSYTEDRVGVLIGRAPLGLDLECPDREVDVEPLAGRVLRPEEQAAMSAMPGHERHAFFFSRWVEKEAVSKAIGLGLEVGFAEFDAAAAADELGGALSTRRLSGGVLAATLLPAPSTELVLVRWEGPGVVRRLAVEGG